VSSNNLALVFATGLLCTSCCKNSVREQERSPSGEWIARVTYADCGVLADGTAVTLRRARSWFARDKVVVGLDGSHSVGITWRDARTLRVFLPESARERNFADQKIVNRHEDVEGIHIEYTQL
jgi:hypothetical protein